MDKRLVMFFIVCISVAFVVAGCAASSRTVRTEETITTETSRDASSIQGNQGNYPAGESAMAQEERKTVVKEERSASASGSGGVISTTLDLIGKILAFPFKVIGGIFEFIF